MKKWCFRKPVNLVPLLLVLVVLCSSCKKDDEIPADYVGTWIATIIIPTPSGFTGYRDVMTFTEDSVVDLIQIPGDSSDHWIDYMNLKGSVAVKGNILTVTIAEVGISTLSAITGLPTGTIVSYKDGSEEFEALLTQTGQSKVFESEYSVSGNQLTVKTDNNNDGDYLDAEEISVYTRQ